MEQNRILLIGSEQTDPERLESLLEAKGLRIIRARGTAEACQKLAILSPRLVLAALGGAPNHTAAGLLDLLQRAQGYGLSVPLLVLHPPGLWEPAMDTLRRAGADLVPQPVSADLLLAKISTVMEAGPDPPWSQPPPPSGLPPDMVLGQSPAIQRVLEQVRLVAAKNTTVLITGETGTGKERISRAIHLLSHRRLQPMISVNCGGIPATLLEDEFFGHVKGAFTDAHQGRLGRFEQADHSTIFLDEIGDLPLELQPKLLRVLQEREIHRVGGVDSIHLDVRVIAATNVDLWSRVHEGLFREDLFYRINVFPIHLPPLRERREDVPMFVAHFLDKLCRRDKLPPKRLRSSAETELMSRPWPGNIRELENAVEIAVIRSQDRADLDASDFPAPRSMFSPAGPAGAIAAPADFKGMVNQFEKDLIVRVLERTHGNKSQAAQILRLKRTTLIEKLKKLGLATDPITAGS